jgi:acylphosphatase
MSEYENQKNPSFHCIRMRIEGRVQGVGFRMFVLREAQARGLDGFVRNRRDGGVEVVVSGLDVDVASMLAACREGPSGCRVDFVKVLDETASVAKGFTMCATV